MVWWSGKVQARDLTAGVQLWLLFRCSAAADKLLNHPVPPQSHLENEGTNRT